MKTYAADDFDVIRARRDELRTYEGGGGRIDILVRRQMVSNTRMYRYYAVTQRGYDTLGTAHDWWSDDTHDAIYRAKTPGVVIVEGADLAEGEEWARFIPDGREFKT